MRTARLNVRWVRLIPLWVAGHRRAARQREATAARRLALSLAEEAGGARTPGLLFGDGIDPLSGREREVALLAVAGLASKNIAQHLFLSKRTVDSHLNRVYRKLGVTGRNELGAALGAALSNRRRVARLFVELVFQLFQVFLL